MESLTDRALRAVPVLGIVIGVPSMRARLAEADREDEAYRAMMASMGERGNFEGATRRRQVCEIAGEVTANLAASAGVWVGWRFGWVPAVALWPGAWGLALVGDFLLGFGFVKLYDFFAERKYRRVHRDGL